MDVGLTGARKERGSMKIAILGGGVGSMTAAYCLTNPGPDGKVPHHDITVYQLGWRLGGKGASGRNAAEGNRIEEHGLHIWMGFYANAFRMIRDVYAELDRPANKPLATWKDAFKPQSVYTMMDQDKHGEWIPEEWIITSPLHPGEPGDQTSFGSPCGYHGNVIEWVRKRIEAVLEGREHHTREHTDLHATHVAHLHTVHAALHAAAALAPDPKEHGKADGPDIKHHHKLLELALEGVQLLIGPGLELTENHPVPHRVFLLADVAVATLLGMLRDLCQKPWTAIDDQEWRAWLLSHGMHKQTEWCSFIRAFYAIVFAYRDGDATDPSKGDLAAGTTICTLMRINFDFHESIFLKMQAGMGDTIFGPLYQVLRRRGVKFEFFHRLRDVVPSADGTQIDALRIGVQATVANGGYEPLVDVRGLPCWPSEPLWDQLEEGKELHARGIDLEAYGADWPDVRELVLERGRDFDHVVFGLSIGALPYVCASMLEQKESWRQAVKYVKAVRTQASQLWLNRNVADLGWPPALDGRCYGERAVFGAFVEPLDTWADMSQLIPVEDWTVPVNNIAYFCGTMSDSAPANNDTVRELTRTMLEQNIYRVWTSAAKPGQFRYEWLAVNDPGAKLSDEQRFQRQFFRANTEPTELYVLSVSGSTKHRLDPADCGYANLSLAGDWVANGFALGCVESAVLGGMKGVQRLCPGMVIVE
jgi:uncharacterized protein with NAD-binding domain and iron-sulfur cluster